MKVRPYMRLNKKGTATQGGSPNPRIISPVPNGKTSPAQVPFIVITNPTAPTIVFN